MIVFKCKDCKSAIRADDSRQGKRISCPTCKAQAVVPVYETELLPTRRRLFLWKLPLKQQLFLWPLVLIALSLIGFGVYPYIKPKPDPVELHRKFRADLERLGHDWTDTAVRDYSASIVFEARRANLVFKSFVFNGYIGGSVSLHFAGQPDGAGYIGSIDFDSGSKYPKTEWKVFLPDSNADLISRAREFLNAVKKAL